MSRERGSAIKRIIVGITGASGSIHGIRLLEALRARADVETHLVLSDTAKRTIPLETDYTVARVSSLADHSYPIDDLSARLSSGSFLAEGMVVIPCSIKSMAQIANSICDNLLVRAADVTLKERRKLVLVVRETPLHLGHLRLLTSLAEYGATILPPMPAFYHRPKTVDDIVNQTVGKVLDQFGIEHDLFQRWQG